MAWRRERHRGAWHLPSLPSFATVRQKRPGRPVLRACLG